MNQYSFVKYVGGLSSDRIESHRDRLGIILLAYIYDSPVGHLLLHCPMFFYCRTTMHAICYDTCPMVVGNIYLYRKSFYHIVKKMSYTNLHLG